MGLRKIVVLLWIPKDELEMESLKRGGGGERAEGEE